MDQKVYLMLGELKAKVESVHESQGRVEEKIGGIDKRLRKVETKSAIHGAAGGVVSAGFVSVGIAFIKEALGKGIS